MSTLILRQGDCVEVMATLTTGSIDHICCDPPYGLEFMGKGWDRLVADPDVGMLARKGFTDMKGFAGFKMGLPSFSRTSNVRCRKCHKWRVSSNCCVCDEPAWPTAGQAQNLQMQLWHERWLEQCFRVLVPGGTIQAFSGTRTVHRLAAATSAVGFEDVFVRSWTYGSGFPKSHDVSKGIDKQLGAERKVIGRKGGRYNYGAEGSTSAPLGNISEARGDWDKAAQVTAPATPQAIQWSGWGTALKPAWEPVVIGHKPI